MNFEQMSLFDLIPTDPETPGEGGLHETKPVKDVVHGVSYSLEPVEGYLEVRNLWVLSPPKFVTVVAEKAWVRLSPRLSLIDTGDCQHGGARTPWDGLAPLGR